MILMIISELSSSILDPRSKEEGILLLKKIEYIARVSHRTEDRVTENSYDKFLRSVVLTHGDFSVIEHASATVELELDRGLTHEWVRHRLGAYTQESTRFVNYGKQANGVRFIDPFASTTMEDPRIGSIEWEKYKEARTIWLADIKAADASYTDLLRTGMSPQIARSVLPTCTASKLVVTYDLRMWRHFFIMRTCREAHPQMRAVTIPLLEKFQSLIPILYEDIEPEMRQADAMRLLR